ncbi:zinc-dependent alcohol dehydrogenase [Candidatus Poriferisocius sp.]|uniref:zinc-dependent alcohol dehydrogenase n=1 Tax=Candidatus Poriferisocius sp. TaxID=3101276 RepID=UPI003B5B6EED
MDDVMRAVRCVDGRATVAEVPVPVGEGVRIKTASAGVCGSDLHMMELGFLGPFTVGHEFAGWLDDGRPVAVEPIRGCGACGLCRAGHYNRCPATVGEVAGVSRDGGMADEVLMWPEAVVPLPAGVDARDACLVEPLAIAVHGFAMVGLRGDLRVAVIGGGTIGQTALAVAALAGCEVGLVARHDAQKEAGARLGAVPMTEEPYDVVVEAAGTTSALADAARVCRPGGTILVLGTYWEGMELPGMDLSMKEITVVPSSMYGRSGAGRDFDLAAAALARLPDLPDAIITHRFPLDACADAFATAADRSSGAIKVVLEP